MNLPNLLTLFRIISVPVFFTFLITLPSTNPHARMIAAVIFTVSAATDAADGFLARIFNQKTELGAFLDPLADKFLIVAGFVGILVTQQAVFKPPVFIQVIILFREIVLIGGFLTVYFVSRNLVHYPNALGKITTCAQMLLIIFCLLNWPPALLMSYLTASLTVASAIVYVWSGMSKLSKEAIQ